MVYLPTNKEQKAKRLVGKCFRHDNGNDPEFGPVFVKVLAVMKGWNSYADVLTDHFMNSPNAANGIQVERHSRLSTHDGKLDGEYIPITEEEYERETRRILALLGLVTMKDANNALRFNDIDANNALRFNDIGGR